jgi:hypothetical protein
MEIKNVNGWVARVPEESYQKKFSDKVKSFGEFLINRKRADHGTKGNVGDTGDWDEVAMAANFKKGRDETFAREDVAELKTNSEPIQENPLEVDDQLLEMKKREGDEEVEYLKKQQNSEGSVKIDDNTEFSDGSTTDERYASSLNDEPSLEELRAIEKEERDEKELRSKEIDFYSDRGNMGERGKGSRLV